MLRVKYKYAMNAIPDFCMNFHAHIRVGFHGSFLIDFEDTETLDDLGPWFHSLIALLPRCPMGSFLCVL
jgi:hypothetical protein